MQHTTQVAIARTLLDCMDNQRMFTAGEEVAHPVQDYLDPNQFARERTLIFRQQPIAAGFSSQLQRPGDFITHNDTGVPILIVRNTEGRLNAFINACRHRGTQIITEPCGREQTHFVCPYHHWTYDTDGALTGIPMAEGFPALDRSTRHLVRLPVAERFGIVWVRATPGMALDIEAYLGEALCEELDRYRFDQYHHFKSTVIPTAMNWKLMYDTFLEFYHAIFVHTRTLRQLMARNIVHFEPLGHHYRMVAAKKSIRSLQNQPESEWNLLQHAVVSYAIFPNLAINFHGDHVAMYRIFPTGNALDASNWYFSMLLPEAAVTEKAVRYFEKNFNYIVETGAEDVEIGERIQRTLDSGANETVMFGEFEPILSWYHREVARVVAAG